MTEELEAIAAPDPRLIQELFDKDPLNLTEQDLDTIIAFFRADRVNYLQKVEEKAKKPKAEKKEKVAKGSQSTESLLDMLDL